MEARAVQRNRGIDRECAIGEFRQHPRAPSILAIARTLRWIPAFNAEDADLQLEQRDDRNEEAAGIFAATATPRTLASALPSPALRNSEITLVSSRNISSKSAAFVRIAAAGVSKTMSESPGIARASTEAPPARRRGADTARRLEEHGPVCRRSVMKTGPFCAAFFARPMSWFSSRLESVVMVTEAFPGCSHVTTFIH